MSDDIYRVGNIKDIHTLVEDTVKKRNEFYNILENDNYSEDIKEKIKNQEAKVSVSIFTPEIVAEIVSDSVKYLRQMQESKSMQIIKFDNYAFVLGSTYYLFGEVCSLCRQVLMAQLVKSSSWNIDTTEISGSKLIAPIDDSFSLDDLKLACNKAVVNNEVFKEHLILEHKNITEVNRYIMSFLLYQA